MSNHPAKSQKIPEVPIPGRSDFKFGFKLVYGLGTAVTVNTSGTTKIHDQYYDYYAFVTDWELYPVHVDEDREWVAERPRI